MIYVNARAIILRGEFPNLEILIQERDRENEPDYYELPGGQINEFEAIFEALRREVKEETGLDLIEVEKEDLEIKSTGSFVVQAVKPFTLYQTLEGPIDSFGAHFKCRAHGALLANGDCTKNPKWVPWDVLKEMLKDEKKYSPIDIVALKMFIRELENKNML